MSVAAPYNFSVDRGSDWSKVLTIADNNGDPVPITDIFTTDISIGGTTSPSVTADPLTYVSTDLWTSNGSASVPGSGTWIRIRRASGAWEITKWVNGSQVTGYWTSDSNPNHPAWVESWTAFDGATGEPEVDSTGMFFEGSVSLQERGPDILPFEFTTVGDGTDGQVIVSLSRSYTRSLSSGGTYRYDWFVYRGRKRSRLVAGRLTVQGSSTGVATGIPVPAFGHSPAVSWGSITGTLSNQTDLQAALDAAGGGSNSVTSTTTSDGTADLLLLNVEAATAEVTGTLTAPHIHGNLAGSLYAHVRAAENLAKGDPVYVSGSHGSGATLIAEVSKADASNAAKMPAVGIMDADVLANATGHMVISGTISDLATNAYSINAELYVAAGGGLTATPPTARAQPVARVERSNANNGAILVKVNGLSASDATSNTLVRRTSGGSASFSGVGVSGLLDVGDFTADGTTGAVVFGSGALVQFDAISYTYSTGADAAHRTALGSGATGDALFTAASLTAVRSVIERRVFVKPSDTTKNNDAALAADPYFQNIPVDAGVYRIYVELMGTSNATAGLASRISHPANSRPSSYIAAIFYGVAASGATIPATGTTTTLPNMNANGTRANHGFLDYTFASSGTISVEWAQNTATVVDTILRAGSYLIIEKLS